MEKLTITIDEIKIKVAGTYHEEQGDGINEEHFHAYFEVDSYKIEPKGLEHLLAWYKKDVLEEMISEAALDEIDGYFNDLSLGL